MLIFIFFKSMPILCLSRKDLFLLAFYSIVTTGGFFFFHHLDLIYGIRSDGRVLMVREIMHMELECTLSAKRIAKLLLIIINLTILIVTMISR